MRTTGEAVTAALLRTQIPELRAAIIKAFAEHASERLVADVELHCDGEGARLISCPQCQALAPESKGLIEWKPTCRLVATLTLVSCTQCGWFGEPGDA